jgi:PAS domain S-box-containing protein
MIAEAPPTRLVWNAVLGMLIYAVLVSTLLARNWGGPWLISLLTYWYALPPQIVAAVLLIGVLRMMRPDRRRLAWLMVLGALVSDILASLLLNYVQVSDSSYNPWPCALFLVCLAFCMASIVAMFLHLGGIFRSWRLWLDASVLATGFGTMAWLYLLGPSVNSGLHGLQYLVVTAYTCAEGLIVVLLALLVIQIQDWRAERPALFLIGGQALFVIGDIGWLALQAREQVDADSWLTIGCYCLAYALLGAGAVSERTRPVVRGTAAARAGGVAGFLPALVVLVGIAGVIAVDATPFGVRRAVLVRALICGITLFAARQFAAQYEIRRLYRTLAQSEAEAKLTELVRRSADVFGVIDASGALAYVSPAAEELLGVSTPGLVRSPAARLLGPAGEDRFAPFLRNLAEQHAARAEMEMQIYTPAGERRVVHVIGSDQRDNPAIRGITLTIRDVTEQRQLEQDLVEVTAREQQRLSIEIHEGLGQELIGISLMLKSLEKESIRNPAGLQDSLDVIGCQINRTIDTARSVATGLAPLQLAGGSLEGALRQLAARTRDAFGVRVALHFDMDGTPVGASEADHVYRIVRESVNNATRHSGCSMIEIELRVRENQLSLSISDDGLGYQRDTIFGSDIGLRMIDYRARMMGGEMHLETLRRGGSRLVVTTRL